MVYLLPWAPAVASSSRYSDTCYLLKKCTSTRMHNARAQWCVRARMRRFVGTLQAYGVARRLKKEQNAPDATHVLVFTKKDTMSKLQGRVPIKLSKANYGAAEWWLLLDKV